MLNKKYGLWIVSGIQFDDKYEALLHATRTNSDVKFWYHNELYASVDKSLLGKISITQLYKERAQQLRDKYDYLILYYSGGSDSHNILMTFINNNIRLDEICVRWPKVMNDKYHSNNIDRSSGNIWSEWDYSISPTLNWISQHHNDIKISIKDYTLKDQHVDNMFENQKHINFRAAMIKDNIYTLSDSESMLINKGKTVGNIFGVNKPILGLENNKVYMFFVDKCLLVANSEIDNPYGSECFYWTPDMPLLLCEQAYQLFLYYNINKDQRKFIYTEDESINGGLSNKERSVYQPDIARKILYSNTWNFRFQAAKMSDQFGVDRYSWILTPDELSKFKDSLIDNIIQRTKLIDKTLLTYSGNINNKDLYLPQYYRSSGCYIGTLDIS